MMLQELALDELTLRMEEAANGRLPEMQARDYFSQLMAGLHHLHQNNIVHRDIKFENGKPAAASLRIEPPSHTHAPPS